MEIGEFLFRILLPAAIASTAIQGRWQTASAMYMGVGMMFWAVTMIERCGLRTATRFAFAWLPAVWSKSVAAWCRGEDKKE